MKEVNLVSIINAFESLSEELFDSYLEYYSVTIKKEEIQDLKQFCLLIGSYTQNKDIFDRYFLGFSIPQIGKEFDLLRLDENSIINIELKREGTKRKFKSQLKKNRYYLSFLKKEIYSFSFDRSSQKLYQLDQTETLTEVSPRKVLTILAAQSPHHIENLETYFSPSDFLVSPFNSTNEFMMGNYFLTLHQEKIKKSILKEINSSESAVISIKGKAGTGKTLLTYDIAKAVIDSEEVLIVHCGYLNNGHRKLVEDFGWKIISIRDINSIDYLEYQLIIIDEAQRIYKSQLNNIVSVVKANSINCIFSYDQAQTLRRQEDRNNISEMIESNLTINAFELTTKIRTNKEVAGFIKCLFDVSSPIQDFNYSAIALKYFNSIETALDHIQSLNKTGWKSIDYTPSTVHTLPYEEHNSLGEYNAHTVIGQEFDKVICIIDKYFCYENGKLSTSGYRNNPYYHPTKMLFQIVSRTRLRLAVIIIDNEIILKRALQIISPPKKR